MTTRSKVLITMISLLVLFLLISRGQGQAVTEADNPSAQYSGTGQSFTSLSAAASTHCWRWGKTWVQRNLAGDVKYAFKVYMEWCANAAETKIVSQNAYICSRAGGFFEYMGCNKHRGSLQLKNLYTETHWHFRGGALGLYLNKYPHITTWLGPHGGVSGTVWYA